MAALLVVLAVGLTSGTGGPGAETASAAPTVGTSERAVRLLDLPAVPRVLLMGDSYTEGWGADPLSEGFAFHIAGPLGWQLTRDGIGATGYRKAGLQQQGTYAQRLWRHPSDAYDLVVLQGGSNDEKFSEADITQSVELTFRTVRQRYPHARLLVLGPNSPYGTTYPNRAKLISVLASSTSRHSVLFIDPSAEHWFVKGDETTLVNRRRGTRTTPATPGSRSSSCATSRPSASSGPRTEGGGARGRFEGTSRSISRILSLRRGGGGDHPSATAVASGLVRPTRELGRAALERSRSVPLAEGAFLVLLPVGFT